VLETGAGSVSARAGGGILHRIHGFLHSTGFVVARNLVLLLAVVFWLALGFWVNRDARRRIRDPFFVVVATPLGLLPPYVGPMVYLLFRPSETLDDAHSRRVEMRALERHLAQSGPKCPVCSSAVEPDYLACPVCTTMLRRPCVRCNAPVEPLWQMCPYCATPVEPAEADLDAALTAEALALVELDDPTMLVPSPEPRVADV
jgi:Double zinc ribbon